MVPIDKERNADRQRRTLPELGTEAAMPPKPTGLAPLLRQYMAEYAATGLPPAYVPLARETVADDPGDDVQEHDDPEGHDPDLNGG